MYGVSIYYVAFLLSIDVITSPVNKILKLVFKKNTPTKKELAQSYLRYPSISEKLPWVEYDSDNQCFLLNDGKSVGAVFELSDIPSESRPLSYLQQLQKGLQSIFQDIFQQYFDDESPWIVQFYMQDELSLKNFYQSVENYIKPAAKGSYFTTEYLRLFKNHLDLMTRKEGLFTDTKVSGTVFRGKIRKIRAVIYRRLTSKSKLRKGRDAVDDLNTIAHAFTSKLESTGIKVKRVTGKEFHDWMLRWFNPAPIQFNNNPDALLENCLFPMKRINLGDMILQKNYFIQYQSLTTKKVFGIMMNNRINI